MGKIRKGRRRNVVDEDAEEAKNTGSHVDMDMARTATPEETTAGETMLTIPSVLLNLLDQHQQQQQQQQHQQQQQPTAAVTKPSKPKFKNKKDKQRTRRKQLLERLQMPGNRAERAKNTLRTITEISDSLPEVPRLIDMQKNEAVKRPQKPSRALKHRDAAMFSAVLSHSVFQKNPLLALQTHIRNTQQVAVETDGAERPQTTSSRQ